MTLESIADKIIPATILAVATAMFVGYIDIQELKRSTAENKKLVDGTDKRQTKHIIINHDNIIKLQEHEKTFLTKEQYYREKP